MKRLIAFHNWRYIVLVMPVQTYHAVINSAGSETVETLSPCGLHFGFEHYEGPSGHGGMMLRTSIALHSDLCHHRGTGTRLSLRNLW